MNKITFTNSGWLCSVTYNKCEDSLDAARTASMFVASPWTHVRVERDYERSVEFSREEISA